ncbi:MAG: FAD-binding oxidoreductase [Patescibacteria group bacterium]|nr:FAD-binding oxidoreductase [Patescibacteria group bacterium]
MEEVVTILMTEFVTHDVKRFVLEKPKNYKFTPGQATEISINKPEWKDERRPFTFTSLNKDKVLEFTIKGYPEHSGVTEQLHKLIPGDELIVRDPWGTINYKGSGVFIAGGAGVTPFIAIFRSLRERGDLSGNKLFFSNKTAQDVILEKEFREMFPEGDLVLTLTEEECCGYDDRYIDKEFLEEEIDDFSQNFYVCGPPGMVRDMKKYLNELGAEMDSVVFEGKSTRGANG